MLQGGSQNDPPFGALRSVEAQTGCYPLTKCLNPDAQRASGSLQGLMRILIVEIFDQKVRILLKPNWPELEWRRTLAGKHLAQNPATRRVGPNNVASVPVQGTLKTRDLPHLEDVARMHHLR